METAKPRVRFAPSPTGHLHIGGARTALFNFLFARRHGGTFILRVEDTDKERSTPEATDAILDGLGWLGLAWDEGPYFQSRRHEIYRTGLERLLKEGKAYRCYCTPAELEERRRAQLAARKPLKYDGRCRDLAGGASGQPAAVRFRVPPGRTEVSDLVKGSTVFDNAELEDLVLARSDFSPTYNFTVVVDDADMGITHVIRGDDHLNNTPKQILLYGALGRPTPVFAHLPLILGPDKQRLSKRHGATSVQSYREMGYLPHALVNFLARLGWSHGDQEIFSIGELIAAFDLKSVGKAAGVFNARKLLWLNHHYIKHESAETLLGELKRFLPIPPERVAGDGWRRMIDLLRERSKTVAEMAEFARFYFLDDLAYDGKAVRKYLRPQLKEALGKVRSALEGCPSFDEASVKPKFEGVLHGLGMKIGDLAQPLRVALTGGTASPGIFEVLELLGRARSLGRIDAALRKMDAGFSD